MPTPTVEATSASCVIQVPLEERANPKDLIEGGLDVTEATWGEEGADSSGVSFNVSAPETTASDYATNTLYFQGVGDVEGIVGGDTGPECVYVFDFAVHNQSAERVTLSPRWLNFWRGDTPLPVWVQGAGIVVPGSGGLVDLDPGDRVEMTAAIVAPSEGDFALDISADDTSHVVIH